MFRSEFVFTSVFTLWYLLRQAALLNFRGIFTNFSLKLTKMGAAEKNTILIEYYF
jgi:hypothetical protein